MNILTHEQLNTKCVGCGNCFNVCPKKAIVMAQNDEGFLYPILDEGKCINCEVCIKVCQVFREYDKKTEWQIGYAAISKRKEYYKNAASGGIFGTIADIFLKQYMNGVVVGATYENGKVFHKIIRSINDIASLQNSKYVQSGLNSIFLDIKKELTMNNAVLFSGTPCQIYALKLFLRNVDCSRLFTMDLICHGVPSQAFLEKDLKEYGKHIRDIKFRQKKLRGKSRSGFILSFIKTTNKNKRKYVLANRDPYYSLFIQNLSFRKSCYQCQFANLNRVGDITIGDCDSYALYPEFHSGEATSTVIINSVKGNMLFEFAKTCFDYIYLDLEKEAKINTQLYKPSPLPEKRDDIIKDINTLGFTELQRKYAKPNDLKAKILVIKFLYI